MSESPEAILNQLDLILKQSEVAAFIYEPLVQGAAAMKVHNRDGLNSVLAFLRQRGVLLIADEVMTGFGKTGTCFASEQLETRPDIICLSKALTAGLLPMAVTSCSEAIFDAFYSDQLSHGFFHGHTYTANPLACTAALAGIELLLSEGIQHGIDQIVASHKAFLEKISSHPKVTNCRQCGVILALDLAISASRYGNFRDEVMGFFMERGIFLRPLGNTVYLLPPYVISSGQLQEVYHAIEELLDQL
jgi:adenosylmethionine-8-amino-7-oxononanoate aminotransferase